MPMTYEERREYHREYRRARYHSDPEYRAQHIAQVEANNARYAARNKAILDEFRRYGCTYCDEAAECCMAAHHIDPATKERTIGQMMWRRVSEQRLRAELAKCECVCHNCHAKIHAGRELKRRLATSSEVL